MKWAVQAVEQGLKNPRGFIIPSVSIRLTQCDTMLPMGTKLEFVSRNGSEMLVRYRGGEYWIPISATDLR